MNQGSVATRAAAVLLSAALTLAGSSGSANQESSFDCPGPGCPAAEGSGELIVIEPQEAAVVMEEPVTLPPPCWTPDEQRSSTLRRWWTRLRCEVDRRR